MPGTVIIFRTDGTTEEKNFPEFPRDAAMLKILKDGVNGYIEVVPFFIAIKWKGMLRKCVVFCNEDGKHLNMPLNIKATSAWAEVVAPLQLNDVLVGNVVVVFGDDEFLGAL